MKTQEVKEHIVNWLKDYVNQSKTEGFVIGVSGGIDSAVTSTLAAETGLPLICLEMPIYQSDKEVGRAKKHIDFLKENYPNVSAEKTELTAVFDAFIQAMPEVNNEEERKMSLVNTRARLRMTTLYYFAALNNYLVLGTGNKVEDFGVGFYTKYGDGGVDVSPIADLVKTEVYALGNTLNIINDIIIAPPTDGLWGDERTDEDQIGASYPELEWAMAVVEKGIVDFTSFTPRQQEVFQIYTRLNTANQHKMKPIPVCIIPKELKL